MLTSCVCKSTLKASVKTFKAVLVRSTDIFCQKLNFEYTILFVFHLTHNTNYQHSTNIQNLQQLKNASQYKYRNQLNIIFDLPTLLNVNLLLYTPPQYLCKSSSASFILDLQFSDRVLCRLKDYNI